MTAICLIDTTVYVEILDVPGKAGAHAAVLQQFEQKVHVDEEFFLPMAVIFETGNHIGQVSDGRQRRQRAELFVKQISDVLDGTAPFAPIGFPDQPDVRAWIDEFPDRAMRGIGLGDLSIIKDWEKLRRQNSARRVYIWTLDSHLSGYDTVG